MSFGAKPGRVRKGTDMDSTVLQPAPGQAVVQVSDPRRHEHSHGHGHDHPRVWEISQDFASVRRDIAISDDRSSDQIERVRKDVCDTSAAVQAGFKDAAATAYQVEGRALLEAAKNANTLGIQATNNFNLLNVEMVKNAAAAELSARTIAAEAARQLAECCCELKALVSNESRQTRDLITANETQNLRDKITRLELQNASLFTRNVPPIQPVQAQ